MLVVFNIVLSMYEIDDIILGDLKVSKINDVMDLSPNQVFSSKNGNIYYIRMN